MQAVGGLKKVANKQENLHFADINQSRLAPRKNDGNNSVWSRAFKKLCRFYCRATFPASRLRTSFAQELSTGGNVAEMYPIFLTTCLTCFCCIKMSRFIGDKPNTLKTKIVLEQIFYIRDNDYTVL